ncbi:TRADD-N-associated membrane domain-containing protein [Streptomyces sp. NPDC000888]
MKIGDKLALFGRVASIFTSPNEDSAGLSPEAAARRRQAWRNSNEVSRLKKLRRNFIAGIVPAVATGAFVAWLADNNPSRKEILQGMGLALIAYSYMGSYAIILVKQRLRREFRDRILLGEALDELRQAEDEIGESDVSFQSLWIATQKRLDYYHKIATSQAEKSFLYAQIAASTGFFVLITSAVIAAFARSTTGSVVAGAAGVTASGLGAYIGSTFTKTQERSSAQLEAYFKQPLEFSKYLAAERLVETLAQADRSPAIRDIITAITGGQTSPRESTEKAPET